MSWRCSSWFLELFSAQTSGAASQHWERISPSASTLIQTAILCWSFHLKGGLWWFHRPKPAACQSYYCPWWHHKGSVSRNTYFSLREVTVRKCQKKETSASYEIFTIEGAFFSMFFLVLNSNIQSAYSNFFLLSCFLTNWIWMSVHLLHCNLDMMATGLLTRLQTKLFSFILFRSARQKWPRCADTQRAAHKSQLYFLWHLLEAPAVLLLFQQGGRHAAAAARMNVTAGAMPDGGSCVVFFSVIASALCRVCVCMCVCEHAGKVKTTYGMKLKPTWVTARWFQFFAARPMHEQQAEEEEERWGGGHANT